MERLTDIDQEAMEILGAKIIADAIYDEDLLARIDDDGFDIWDPEVEGGLYVDRCDRPHLAYYQAADGRWVPSSIKINDDVMLWGCIPARVCGPACNRTYFSVYNQNWFGNMTLPVEITAVSDRAPADPEEEPMPLYNPVYPPPWA